MHEKTGLDLYHIDSYFWNEDWDPTLREEWKEIHQELMSKDEWILDGNYGVNADIRIKKADTIFFFDFNRVRAILPLSKEGSCIITGQYQIWLKNVLKDWT